MRVLGGCSSLMFNSLGMIIQSNYRIMRLSFLPYILIPLLLIANETVNVYYRVSQSEGKLNEEQFDKHISLYAHATSIAFGVLLGMIIKPKLL